MNKNSRKQPISAPNIDEILGDHISSRALHKSNHTSWYSVKLPIPFEIKAIHIQFFLQLLGKIVFLCFHEAKKWNY